MADKNWFHKSWGELIKFATFLFTLIVILLLTQELLFTFSPIKNLELRSIDERFSLRGERDIKDTSNVLILEITQNTYDQIPNPYKTWPWPRFIFTKVIENLEQAGVRAIGLDLLMSNPDRLSVLNDSLLIQTIRKYGNIVVAGKVNIGEEAWVSKTNKAYVVEQFVDSDYDEITINLNNIFYAADSSIGIVQTPADFDDVYRRYQPYIFSDTYNLRIPSFGFALVNKYLNLSPKITASKLFHEQNFKLGPKKIPAFDNTSMLINFYGADRTFPRLDFYKILDDKDFTTQDEIDYESEINEWVLLDKDQFKNKIVIIGSTMAEDKDFFNISLSRGQREGDNIIAGVEFHANAIQNIIWNDYIFKQPKYQEILFLIIITFLTFYLSSILKQKKIKHQILLEIINLAAVLIIVASFYKLGVYLFISKSYLISIVNPVLAVVISYFSATAYHFIKERSQNRIIKGMFSTYVSSDLVNVLLKDPGKLKLGGEKRNLTILFSDIAGFTSFSEKLKPEQLVEFINEYLTEMTDIVLANKGTLDKYIGDAVMAFWGAPLEVEEKEYCACKTALEMQNRISELHEKWQLSGEDFLQVRIGINSGDVVVGNIGGRNRFDYTVMGDNVNLASRLEGANKQYGTGIMISESTYLKVDEKTLVRELDTIRVKGKLKPTKVFELIGFIGDRKAETKLVLLSDYFNGLTEYKNKNFIEAYHHFEKSFNNNNEDNASYVYMMRSKYYIDNPPEDNWDGVFVMKTK